LKDLAVGTAVLLAAALPSAAFAQQEAAPQDAAPPADGAAQSYSDEEVDAFADAVTAAAAVDEQWRPRIEAAGDVEEAQELMVQSQTEMVAAVEETGITDNDYNEIYAQAQTDPALADRILAALQERTDEAGGL
jgi:hypothetical protein